MDETIELSDSSKEETIVLDDTNDKNKTIDLESSTEVDNDKTDHYVTAASNTKFLENTSPPKITSTPNVQLASKKISKSPPMFQDVEDEFLHDDSFAEAEEATRKSPTQIEEDNDNDDSAIESEKAPVNAKRQTSTE